MRSTPTRPRTRSPEAVARGRLAHELVQRLPWLTRQTHIGQLCAVLARTGVDPADWTAPGLLSAIETACKGAGFAVADPAAQRNPLAYFGWLIRAGLATAPEPDRRRQERDRATTNARLAAQADVRRAEAELRVRLEREATEIDAIVAGMRQPATRT